MFITLFHYNNFKNFFIRIFKASVNNTIVNVEGTDRCNFNFDSERNGIKASIPSFYCPLAD
jgi:hypothetical protein